MPKCNAKTLKGVQCKGKCMKDSATCYFHAKKSSTEDEEACCICYGTKLKPVVLDCKHEYCKSCISLWFAKGKSTCPCCRSVVTDAQIEEVTGKAPVRERVKVPLPISAIRALFEEAVNMPLEEGEDPESRSRMTLEAAIQSLSGWFTYVYV